VSTDKAEISRSRFLGGVRASGLIPPDALAEALADAPDSPRAKHLARHLYKKGLLTHFQAQHLLAGNTGGFFLGQYRILDLIGRGGMGKVYKAEHMTMQRIVALKVLAAEMTRTERARQLFRMEVRAAARLAHPNIATAYDANEVDGRAFLVLEYVSGPSLSALVKSDGPLPVGQACEYIRQAALGLQHAHEQGMVHRDIKPSNLLVQPNAGRGALDGGTIKLVDFGLALLPGADEAMTADRLLVIGTPDYLAPEQARGDPAVDIRSDLYGLGCTFYYLLTGQVPFPGGTALEKLARHASDTPEPVDHIRPIVPPGVAACVRRLMAKNPSDRFATPGELADVLTKFAEVHPVHWAARPLPRPAPPVDPDAWPPDDATPSASDMTAQASGTLSIAEFAASLNAAERALMAGANRGRRAFLWLSAGALALGFVLGLILILLASHLSRP
jgi:serine/threonine protein kinase